MLYLAPNTFIHYMLPRKSSFDDICLHLSYFKIASNCVWLDSYLIFIFQKYSIFRTFQSLVVFFLLMVAFYYFHTFQLGKSFKFSNQFFRSCNQSDIVIVTSSTTRSWMTKNKPVWKIRRIMKVSKQENYLIFLECPTGHRYKVQAFGS